MALTKVKLIADGAVKHAHIDPNSVTTDSIGEGAGNLFYTDARVASYLSTNNYATSAAGYFTAVSHDTVNKILTFTKSNSTTEQVNLTQYIDDTNLARLTSGTVNASTGIATFTRDDASTFTVDFSSLLDDTNDYVTSASFNTTDGVLTLTRFGGTNVTVDLDGRYLTSETDSQTLSWVDATNTLSISNGNSVTLTGFANASHTHLWADITDKPTTFTPSSHEHTYIRTVAGTTTADAAMPNTGYALQHFLAQGPSGNDGHTIGMTWTGTSAYGAQIWIDTDPNNIMAFRSRSNTGVWTGWNTLVHSGNIGSQSVSYASNAGTLDNIDSSQFLRSDVSDSWSGLLTYTGSNNGLQVGGIRGTFGGVELIHLYNRVNIGYPSGWGAQSAPNWGLSTYGGVELATNDGYTTSGGSMRAPIFYDSNNTGYYVDPASTSNLNAVSINGYADFQGDAAITGGTGFGVFKGYTANYNHYIAVRGIVTTDSSVITGGHQTTFMEHMSPADDSTGWFFKTNAITGVPTVGRISYTSSWFRGILYGNDSVRGPIFYDSNNTAWYTNPADRSILNTLQLGGSGSDTTNLKLDVQGNMAIRNSSGLYFGVSTNNYNSWTTRLYASGSTQYFNGQEFRFDNQGYGSTTFATIDSQGVTSNIFRDSDNTNFYLDPASTSKLYSINDQNDCTYIAYKHSGSDFVDGTLVTTNIPSGATNGASFVLDATGKSYSSDPPFMFTAQGYLYNNTIISASGQHMGKPGFSTMKIFDYGGYLAFWWPRVSYWNSFEVRVRDAGGGSFNRVVNVTNSTEPASSKKVTVTMKANLIYDYNPGSTIGGDLYGQTFYDTDDTAYYLNPQGFSNLGRIKFNDVVSNGAPIGDACVGRNYAYNTLELKGYGAEMMIGSQSTDIHINYRYCNNVGSNTYTPQNWYWRNGTSSGWSNHYFGNVYSGLYYDRDDTSYYVNPNSSSTAAKLHGGIELFYIQSPNYTASSSYGWNTYIRVGKGSEQPQGAGFPTSTPTSAYGLFVNANSDGCFYGVEEYSTGNFRPLINWGDDAGDTPFRIAHNNSTKFTLDYSGAFTAIGDVRAPYFYNADNTSEYIGYLGGGWGISLPNGNMQINSIVMNSDLYFYTSASSRKIYMEHGTSSTNAIEIKNTITSSSYAMYFKNSGNFGIGAIIMGSSSTTFSTSSDYRLKENVVPMTGSIDRVKQLNPVNFNFIIDPDTTVDGFIAHEAQAVVPEAVAGEKDAVDEEGNIKPQGIDQSKLVPLLTSALQEAIAKIEELEQRLTDAGL
jgi:hypothetical protein